MTVCPKDREPLREEGGGVGICDACRGLWIPPRMAVGLLGKVLPAHAGEGPDFGRQRSCPEGHGILRTVPHHGVEVEVCPECGGVWLDSGELDKIRAAMAPKRIRRPEEEPRFAARTGVLESIADAANSPVTTILTASHPLAGLLEVVADFFAEPFS